MTINAGGVFFDLRLDRGQLQTLIREARDARRQLDSALNRGQKGVSVVSPGEAQRIRDTTQALTAYQRQVRELVASTQNLLQLSRANLITPQQRQQLADNIRSLAALTDTAELSQQELRSVFRTLADGTVAMQRFAASTDPAAAELKEFNAEIKRLTSETQGLLRGARLDAGLSGEQSAQLRSNIELLRQLGQSGALTGQQLGQVNGVLLQYENSLRKTGAQVKPLEEKVEQLSSAVRILRNDFIAKRKTADTVEKEMRELTQAMETLRRSEQLTTVQTRQLASAQATAARTLDGMAGRASRLGLAFQTQLALTQQFGAQLFRFGPIGQVAATGLNAATGVLTRLGPAAITATAGVVGLTVAFGALASRGIPELARVQDAFNVLRASGEQNLDAVTAKIESLIETGGRAVRQFSRSELTESVAELVKAGVTAAEALEIVASGAQLAAAEQQDLAQSNALLLQNLRQFNFGAERTAEVADQIAQASLLAASGARELQIGLATVGPVADAANLSFAETLGLLVNLDNKGLSAAERGATGLRNVLDALASPTKNARELIEGFGISLEEADGSVRPVRDVLFDLRDALLLSGATFDETTGTIRRSTEAVRAAANIFDTRGVTSILALDESTDRYAESIAGATGVLREWSDLMAQGTRQAQERLKAATDDLALAFADALAPAIQGTLNTLTALVEGLTSFFDLFASEERRFAQRIQSFEDAAAAIGNSQTRTGLYRAVNDVANLLDTEGRRAWRDYATEVVASTNDVLASAAALQGIFLKAAAANGLAGERVTRQVRVEALTLQQGLQSTFQNVLGTLDGGVDGSAEVFRGLTSGVREANDSLDELEGRLIAQADAGSISEDALQRGTAALREARGAINVYGDAVDALNSRTPGEQALGFAAPGVVADLVNVLNEDLTPSLLQAKAELESIEALFANQEVKAVVESNRTGLGGDGGGGGGAADSDDEVKLRTVRQLFAALEDGGIAAERRAAAFAGTSQELDAQIENVRTRVGLFQNTLTEAFNPERLTLGREFQLTEDEVAFLVQRIEELNAELKDLGILDAFADLSAAGARLDRQFASGAITQVDLLEGKVAEVSSTLDFLADQGLTRGDAQFDFLEGRLRQLETLLTIIRDTGPAIARAFSGVRDFLGVAFNPERIGRLLDQAERARAFQEALDPDSFRLSGLGARTEEINASLAGFADVLQDAGVEAGSLEADVSNLVTIFAQARGSLLGLDVGTLAALRADLVDLRSQESDPLFANLLSDFIEDIDAALAGVVELSDRAERAAALAEAQFGTALTQALFNLSDLRRQGFEIRTIEDALQAFLTANIALTDQQKDALRRVLPSAAEESVAAVRRLSEVFRGVGIDIRDADGGLPDLQTALSTIDAGLGQLDAEELVEVRGELEALAGTGNVVLAGLLDPLIADALRLLGLVQGINANLRSAAPISFEDQVRVDLNRLQVATQTQFSTVGQAVQAFREAGFAVTNRTLQALRELISDDSDLLGRGLEATAQRVVDATRGLDGFDAFRAGERDLAGADVAQRLGRDAADFNARLAEAKLRLIDINNVPWEGRFNRVRAAVIAINESLGDFSGQVDLTSLGIADLSGRFIQVEGNLQNLSTAELGNLIAVLADLQRDADGTDFGLLLDPFIEDARQAALAVLQTRAELDALAEDRPFDGVAFQIQQLLQQAGREGANLINFEVALAFAEEVFGELNDEFVAGLKAVFDERQAREEAFLDKQGQLGDERNRKQRELLDQQEEALSSFQNAAEALTVALDLVADIASGRLSPTDDPQEFANALLSGAGDIFGSVLDIVDPSGLTGAIARIAFGVIESFQRALQALFDPSGPVARAFRDTAFSGITGGLTSALTEFVNGDLTTSELEAKLYEAVRTSITSAILDSLVQSILLEGALRPLLEKLGRAVAEGRTDDINGIVQEIISTVKAVAPQLIDLAGQIAAGFGEFGLDLSGDDQSRSLFALPEATTLGLTDDFSILSGFVETIPEFSASTARLVETFDRLVDEGINVTVDGEGDFSTRSAR